MKKSNFLLTAGVMALLTSCYTYREVSVLPEIESYKTRRSVYVLMANTDTSSVFFSEKMPGKLSDDRISGILQYPLVKVAADSMFYKPVRYKRIIDYVYKDGVRYDAFEEKNQVYIYNRSVAVNILYADLKSVQLKIFRPGSTAALVGGSSAGLALIFTIIALNMTFDAGLGGM